MLSRRRTSGQGQKTRGKRRKTKAADAASDLFAYEAHPWPTKTCVIPLDSGMVESECQWLMQSWYKGVGMLGSEDSFNYLVQLRLA